MIRSYYLLITMLHWVSSCALAFVTPNNNINNSNNKNCSAVAHLLRDTSPLPDLTIHVHRNGEASSCGVALVSNADLVQALVRRENACADMDKFVFESVLTEVIMEHLTPTNACSGSILASSSTSNLESATGATLDLAGFCDMGPTRTVDQHDTDLLVRLSTTDTLPCRWMTREGVRVQTISQLNVTAGTIDLYGVPAGRLFQFAPLEVGEVFDISHCKCRLSVLSISPAIFELHDFLSLEDSNEMLSSAHFEKSVIAFNEGNPEAQNWRTSDTGRLTNSEHEATIQQRALRLLGMEEFQEFRKHIVEGPQLLRYNTTAAYKPHFDYMADITGRRLYNFDSEGTGSNRFATILFYLNDVEEGGETVFTKVNGTLDHVQEAIIQELRASETGLEHGSWQESMTAMCRSGFVVKPIQNRAILFYNQHPDGRPDLSSEHGSCPVLKGSKYAANLWVWSSDHPASPNATMREFQTPKAIRAIFRNTGTNEEFRSAELFYGNRRFQYIGFDEVPFHVDTYQGHRWHIKVNGKTLKSFVIDNEHESELLFEF